VANDRAIVDNPAEYSAVTPPRGCEPPVAMADLCRRVECWIQNKGMRLVRQRHGIACQKTKRVIFVDLVLETAQMVPVLLCLYCSTKRRNLLEMDEYMQGVQSICNQTMGFYPQVVSLCMYGSRSNPKMYGRSVNTDPVHME